MNTKQLTKISICTTILCISAYISIPLTPIVITAQTIAVNLIALVLKPKESISSIGIYILLGIIGLPVFAGATSGIGIILGPTGGFILGFIISAPCISFFKGKKADLKRYLFITILIGMPIIYLFGAVWMCIIQKINIIDSIKIAVIPFILGDILKCIISSILGFNLNKINKFIWYLKRDYFDIY